MSDVDLHDSYTESNRLDNMDAEGERASKHNEPLVNEIVEIKRLIRVSEGMRENYIKLELFELAKIHERKIVQFETEIDNLTKQLI